MNEMIIFCFILLSLIFVHTLPSLHPDTGLNIIQLATKYGYRITSHHVETADGYILTLHRISHGPKSTNHTKHPVLLMHGVLSSSVDWINLGPGKALGLLLTDEGYDVWLGNQRGNTWSRQHVSLDPDLDADKFFDFSFHEIGFYDLPAKIDYILKRTRSEKISYVGHSQGTTAFFVMASERPEYNEKIRLMTALAPIVYVAHMPNPLVASAVDNSELIQTLIEVLKIHEFLPHSHYYSDLGNVLCSNGSQYQNLCVLGLNMLAGFDRQIEADFIPVITSNAPAGCSVMQFQHYLQEVGSGAFARYDYGSTMNKAKYDQETPPVYDLKKVTAPVSLYYGNNDWLDAVEDVLKLAEELPNVVNVKKVPLSQFNHLDFLWARNVVNLLYKDVITEIKG